MMWVLAVERRANHNINHGFSIAPNKRMANTSCIHVLVVPTLDRVFSSVEQLFADHPLSHRSDAFAKFRLVSICQLPSRVWCKAAHAQNRFQQLSCPPALRRTTYSRGSNLPKKKTIFATHEVDHSRLRQKKKNMKLTHACSLFGHHVRLAQQRH